MAYSADDALGSARGKRFSRRWIIACPPVLVLFGALAYGALLLLAPPLLWVEAIPRPVDAIVVLGGDGPPRAARASQLYREGMAPHVYVVGNGDCLHISLAMINAGVPASAIGLECKSGNTWENALFSLPLLARDRIGSAIIVTSWFHTRRALATFQALAPYITWLPVGAKQNPNLIDIAASRDGWAVVLEYIKIAGYVVKYGLDPLPTIPRRQAAAQDHDAPASWLG